MIYPQTKEQIEAEHRFQAYTRGFKHGASGSAKLNNGSFDAYPTYHAGYEHGREAIRDAVKRYCAENDFKPDPRRILRSASPE